MTTKYGDVVSHKMLANYMIEDAKDGLWAGCFRFLNTTGVLKYAPNQPETSINALINLFFKISYFPFEYKCMYYECLE